MTITKRYTIENWESGEIKLFDIPGKILNLKAEEIFEDIFHNSVVNVNFVEILFFLIFKSEGWNVIRLPMNRRGIYQYQKNAILSTVKIDGESLHGKGVPDFLLWKPKEKEYKFVEIKFSEENLNKNQIDWYERFKQNVFIARLAKLTQDNIILNDEEVLKSNKLRRVTNNNTLNPFRTS